VHRVHGGRTSSAEECQSSIDVNIAYLDLRAFSDAREYTLANVVYNLGRVAQGLGWHPARCRGQVVAAEEQCPSIEEVALKLRSS
jgi:hypothetical protein